MTRILLPFIRGIVLLASTLGFALMTAPAVAKDEGAYAGGSIGLTTIDICGDLTAFGATTCDDEDTGFKLFGGYKFNRNLAVEGGFVDFGEISASFPTGSATVSSDALFAAAVGILPVSSKFSVFGKLGFFMWDLTATGTGGTVSDDGTDLLIGVGLGFDITERLTIRAEWEDYDGGGDGVNFLSAGLQYNF